MDIITTAVAQIQIAQANKDYRLVVELAEELERAAYLFRHQAFNVMQEVEKAAAIKARKEQALTRNLAAVDFDGAVKFEFKSDKQDIQWTYLVGAENGESKQGRGWSDMKAARSAMSAQLKAYDKKRLGAWGQLLKVEVA
jgi:hypothetical protein